MFSVGAADGLGGGVLVLTRPGGQEKVLRFMMGIQGGRRQQRRLVSS